MTSTIHPRWLTGAVALVALLGAERLARAEEAKAEVKTEGKAEGGEAAESEEAGEEAGEESHEGAGEEGERAHHRKHEKHEEVGVIGADLVLGWGKVPFAVQNPPGSGASPQVPTYSRADKTSSNVQSLILSASAEVVEHFEIGVRVPITFATFNPDGAPSRSTSGAGNVELEGEYGAPIAKGLRLVGALGLALPTASGTELPEDLDHAPAGSVDQSGYDRFSMNKAAAYARGYEDNALFEAGRFGIIPKLGLLYRTHGLSVEPYLKVENLVATDSTLATNYVGELVGALRVGYWIHKQFELAARVWFNTGFAGAADDKTTSGAVEPQVVLRFGPVRPYAGLLVPFAGPPNENSFIGARVGVSAGF